MSDISIITITYNAASYIEQTLKSLKSQSQTKFEYIVIDGSSKDDTLNILSKYSSIISKQISEPDKGIYDAMNKGLRLASGKYIWFMNAGDEISEADCIKKLSNIIKNDPDIIYGETMIIDENRLDVGLRSHQTPHSLPEKLNWKDYKYGMLVCHQSFIVRREIAPLYIHNNLSADIDWEIKCLKKANSIIKYNGILSKYLSGGISQKQHFKSLKDRFFVLQSHFGFITNIVNHIKILIRFFNIVLYK